MGALHKGHLKLISESKKENDYSICSIFINPLQFNNPEDLEKYPRDIEKDISKLEEAGCDLVFVPEAGEFYDNKPVLKFDFGDLDVILEGEHRPGHFNGVGIVVSRLFNLIQADRAYFGLKDLQQFCVISRLVKDLEIPVLLRPVEIVREADGLAMSSRNRRLSSEERKIAPQIYDSLSRTKDLIINGKALSDALEQGRQLLGANFELEYLNIVSFPDFQIQKDLLGKGEYALCVAAQLGDIRLIDNLLFSID